ncbi:MAG: carboxypeptidase-like regulatory domain-containing protein [Flavobacterium sp.]|nr:carboxypeptidase-like regulatory domain-containing protein [Flavobacterium sp.]
MKKCYLLLLFCSLVSQAQYQFTGIIRDNNSKNSLPFATIKTNSGIQTISDLDGKFTLAATTPSLSLAVSYIGYTSTEILLENNAKFYTIGLNLQTGELKEVMLSSNTKGLDIIRKVIARKPQNDPQKKLQTFEFKAYNRLIITASPDSIDGSIDSIFVKKAIKGKHVKIDSSEYKFKKIISKQHLFQTERVSQFQYRGKELKETIIGTKMAGFKQPIYEILSVNLQSFSVYDNQYELFETRYKSPISNSSFQEYRFKLLDSTSIQDRKSYLIYFKNKKKSNAAGLEGVLYVDADNFAICKAIMRIKGLLDVSGTHEFSFSPEEHLWFPTQKMFKIAKGKNNYDIRILGETLAFDSGESDSNSRKKGASDFTYLISETRLFDVKYNNPVDIKNPFQYMEVQKGAERQDEAFWNRYRSDTLDLRSQRTYFALDSVATKNKIEKRLFQGRKILNGYVPFGYFDMDLRYLISFNNYEGFRFGLGGKTSDLFSKVFRIDGYTAYGLKDAQYKYNLGLSTRIDAHSNSWIGASYTDDIREIASSTFAIDKRNFKLYDPRPINLKTFYDYQSWRLYFETKLLPKTESIWQIMQTKVDPLFDYRYNLGAKSYEKYTMTTGQFSLQWNPFSDYLQTEDGRFEVKKRFPKFTFQYTQTIPQFLENDFSFRKIDFRVEYEKNYLNGQKTAVLLESGSAIGDIPLTHLYNTSPNNLTNEKLIERITIAGKNSFETMFFNEFFSSEFAMIHIKHGFKRVEIFRKVKPAFVLVTRAAWGNMKNRERHVGLDFNTLEKGYYESGFELNQIYSGFGLTAFYRYGPYQLAKIEDNLAIKLSFILNLGF